MSGSETRHVTDDRLLDLVDGLLDDDARRAALDHAGSCATCEERLRALAAEAHGLALGAPPLDVVEGGRAQVLSTTVPRWSRPRWIGMGTAAAAALAVLAVLAVFKITPRPDQALDYWLTVDAEQVMLRSVPAHADQPRFLEAVLAYRDHDAARVTALLKDADIPPEYEPLRLLLASAFVHEGRHGEARAVLDRMDIPSLPQPWRDRARWTLYVALSGDGEVVRAGGVLRDLASRPGEFRERALRLIPSRERPPG